MGVVGAGNRPHMRPFSSLANVLRVREAQACTAEKGVTDTDREDAKMDPGALSWELRYRWVCTAFSIREIELQV